MGGTNKRAMFAYLHDLIAVCLAWSLGFLLRFNFEIPGEYSAIMYASIGWVVLIDGSIFLLLRLYRGIWRYTSIHDLKLLLVALGVASLFVPTAFVLLIPDLGIPRSVYVLHPLILTAIMGGTRLAYRAWTDRAIGRLGSLTGTPVVVLGGGAAALSLLKNLARSKEWRVIGILDDDVTKVGRQILGATVLGVIKMLPDIAKQFGVRNAIIAMPSASHIVRKRLVEICREAQVKPFTVPSFEDLMRGNVEVSQIRQVELDDLLGRNPVVLDNAGLHGLLADRVVLVTGAGGSIGSELCRQIARFSPARLVFFEHSEFALYKIEEEFHESFPSVLTTSVIGDVKDRARVESVFSRFKPGVVFHAAAYKHVPLMECENAWQTIQNNVLGTHVVAAAARKFESHKFVLISTDKAVNPVNVMGASKRLAELVCQALQQADGTRYITVRFGNVLGSAGSVIPKFRSQIAAGGPVTVTHSEITRYFMSIPEATQLVLQAALMGGGGEIFVLNMGDPVRIVDLAKELIRLSGLTEDDIKIVISGLRLGEKLYEEVLADDEHTEQTSHAKLRIALARKVDSAWLDKFMVWADQGTPYSDDEVRERLQYWLAEYHPLPPVRELTDAGKIQTR